jgi:hypothetical protein
MVDDDGGRRWRDREAALGGLLLLLGVLVLASQALGLELGRVGWPFFVVLPGLGLLGLGLTSRGRPGEVLAMAGGVVTMVGLVLLAQQATDRFETWAYAWTLLVVGAGIGRWLAGITRGRRDLAGSGGWLAATGLAATGLAATGLAATGLAATGLAATGLAATGLAATGLAAFLAFAVLFEAVIGIGGRSPGGASRYTLAAVLILAGLVLLGRRLLTTRRP